ncbi:hypothetical protein L914_06695 [Phytophthora nicotianae]|nr:hypothetical protein F443_06914 [Phytophthora nicotianae P1569]ETL42483.1 hypothetical protein L916_06714 [Phytophthora nicotianae]ETM48831.1 hypothetical protein L914_06695 [Phytophthora nicotianae]ETO77911.1 hypothetical protein F444_06968 [Phytophthora nicotianae P1976]
MSFSFGSTQNDLTTVKMRTLVGFGSPLPPMPQEKILAARKAWIEV